MRKTRTLILTAILVTVLGLLTFSLAFAGDSGPNAAGDAVDFGAVSGVPQSSSGGTMCAGGGGVVGISHDDGTFENGYSGNPATVSNFNVADPFTPAGVDYAYTRFCVALVSLGGSNLDFEIVFWANNGGTPGAELAAVPATAANIPGGLPCAWYEYDLSGVSGLPDGSDGDVFIGVRYNPQSFPSRFTCSDESAGTPIAGGYVNFNTGGGWGPIQGSFPNYRSMSTRVEMSQVVQQNPGLAVSKDPATQNVTTNGIADFTITVSNTGDVDLNNVTVTDALVPDCDNAVGTLVVSATVSYNCQDTNVTGSYTNTVDVTSTLVTGGPGPTATASAQVIYTSPTSVSLTGFGDGPTTFSPIWFVAILAVILGVGYAIRRKVTA